MQRNGLEKGVPANWHGKKGRSGRKSLAKEIEAVKEEIAQEALIKLANKKVFVALNNAEFANEIKDFGLPIALKGMVDKKIIEVKDFNSILEKL